MEVGLGSDNGSWGLGGCNNTDRCILQTLSVIGCCLLSAFPFFRPCTNSSCWNEKMLSLETLPNSILRYLGSVEGVRMLESDSSCLNMDSLLHHSETIARTDIMNFLRNAALLCLRAFPRNHKIEEAILIAEEQRLIGVNTPKHATMPSQALAKNLLKGDRQVSLLSQSMFFHHATFAVILKRITC